LSAEDTLGLVLRWLAGASDEIDLGLGWGLPQSTVSKYLRFGIECLELALRSLPDASVRWPSVAEMAQLGERMAHRSYALRHAFGVIDGTVISIPRPVDYVQQGFYYTGHKKKHGVKCVFVVGTDGCILWSATNFGVSMHDSYCAMLSGFYALLPSIPLPFKILGDSGFRAGPQLIVTQTAASLAALDPVDAEAMRDASTLVARVRILVEWCLG
jgi:hypothetical protein